MSGVPFTFDPTVQRGDNWARHPYDNMMHVDNTSDLNKPISDATQAALDTKVDNAAGLKVAEPFTVLGINVTKNCIIKAEKIEFTGHNAQNIIECSGGSPMTFQLSPTLNLNAISIQNSALTENYWKIDNTMVGGPYLTHGTNRQVNSQPIGIQTIDAGSTIAIDCNDATNTYLLTSTTDSVVTISNPYAGKLLSLCHIETTGKITLPVITEDYKYGAVLVTSIIGNDGRGFNLLCTDPTNGVGELLWMVVDN